MKKLLIILLVAFVLIQFFPIDKTNPAVNKGMDFLNTKQTPTALASQIRASCYDCHSNETVYPWYTRLQPVGWFLKDHIDEGRKHLNFSNFATFEPSRQAHMLDECADQVENNDMPLESYTLIHTNAKLTDAQKTALTDYFKKVKSEIMVSNNFSEQDIRPKRPATAADKY